MTVASTTFGRPDPPRPVPTYTRDDAVAELQRRGFHPSLATGEWTHADGTRGMLSWRDDGTAYWLTPPNDADGRIPARIELLPPALDRAQRGLDRVEVALDRHLAVVGEAVRDLRSVAALARRLGPGDACPGPLDGLAAEIERIAGDLAAEAGSGA